MRDSYLSIDKDKKIKYKNDDGNIYAYKLENSEESDEKSYDSDKSYEEEQIGSLEFEDDGEGNIWLKHIEVKQGHRRNKVATEMLKLAMNNFSLNRIACVQESASYSLSLTPHGEKFVSGCLKNGLINPEMCVFSHSSPFILEDGEDDPGLDSLTVREACKNFKSKPKMITKPINFIESLSGDEKDQLSKTKKNKKKTMTMSELLTDFNNENYFAKKQNDDAKDNSSSL